MTDEQPPKEFPTPKGDGVSALLDLASTMLREVQGKKADSLLVVLGRVEGVLKYLHETVLGISTDNEIFLRSILEGTELAIVFADNFDLAHPGVFWVSLHETHPATSPNILPKRYKVFMVDVHGHGDIMNVTEVNFEIPEGTTEKMNFVGLWTEPENGYGELYDFGEMRVSLPLEGRSSLCLAPGGLRIPSGQ